MQETQLDEESVSSYELIDVGALLDRDFSSPSMIGKVQRNSTSHSICRACDEGWSRQLEQDARGPVATMVNMTFPDVPSILALSDYARAHAELGARVAVRGAMFMDPGGSKSIIPDSHFRAFGRGRLPKGISVDLGFCRTPSLLRVLAGPMENEPGSVSRCTYRFAFQTGQLVLMVRHTSGTAYDLHPGTIKLHPEFEIGEDLKIFDDVLDIITWDVLAQTHFNEKAGNVFYGMFG